jgi:hypothetical protein
LTYRSLLFVFLGVLVPKAALAVQGAELYRSQTYFYGRFEARVRYAPGEGVVSSFFLWKDRPGNTGPWNELDFEKIGSACQMQTNIWTGTGTQSAVTTTPSPNICNDYHTYTIEWTPDYIAWLIDGVQLRRVTGASVAEYTQNASGGMAIHFNIWQGDSSFGGNLNTSTLPVYQYISWVQYSSYANNTFTMQWREEFTATTTPSGWLLGNWTAPLNHSTHNTANVKFVNGIAVLALTNDNATGYTGTPPADPASGGTSGTGGSGAGGTGGASGGRGGTVGSAGNGGTTGSGGRGGTTGSGGRGGTTGSGGTSSGAGGTAAGGAGGDGAAGASATGTAGDGAGGTSAGIAGDTGGPAGTSGAQGAAGASATGSGGAAAGGTTGAAGSSSGGSGNLGGGDGGCGCRTAGGGATVSAGVIAVLLLLASRVRRRRTQEGIVNR